MSQTLITGITIFDDQGAPIGKVADAGDSEKVELITETGNQLWLPTSLLAYRNQRWILVSGNTGLSFSEAGTQQQERELDKTSEDSFPASDPPSFTMSDEGKGS